MAAWEGDVWIGCDCKEGGRVLAEMVTQEKECQGSEGVNHRTPVGRTFQADAMVPKPKVGTS